MPGRQQIPSFQLPSGTTAERDGSYNLTSVGSIFYNTDTSNVEIRHEDPTNNVAWRDLVVNNKGSIDLSGTINLGATSFIDLSGDFSKLGGYKIGDNKGTSGTIWTNFGSTRMTMAPIQIDISGLYLLNTYLFVGGNSNYAVDVENKIGYSTSTLVHNQPFTGGTTYSSDGEIRRYVSSLNYSINYSTVLYFNPGYICMAPVVFNNQTANGVVTHMRATRIG